MSYSIFKALNIFIKNPNSYIIVNVWIFLLIWAYYKIIFLYFKSPLYKFINEAPVSQMLVL